MSHPIPLAVAGRVISDRRERFPGSSLGHFKTLQTLFGTRTQCVGVVGERERAKIENRQLWGLLWGPLIHLGTSRHISNHLATTAEPVEPRRVAGLSVFGSTS